MIFYLLLLLISYFLFQKYYWSRRNLPSGPFPLPIVGNIFDLLRENRWERKFSKWRSTYGSVYTYYLGDLPVVAVCDYDDMVKYFVKKGDLFADRYIADFSMNLLRGGEYGVISTNGEVWREQRRFALKVLRDFGLGKNQMEERILAELHYTLNVINRKIEEGKEEIDLIPVTDMAVGSIINAIMSGYRFTEGALTKRAAAHLKSEFFTCRVKHFATFLILPGSKMARFLPLDQVP
uniref:Cytochrome P450 n=1 Tax=Bursaphelenchus xylophilus TaxID=6326 RepID=A0A1I7RUV4_BURXY